MKTYFLTIPLLACMLTFAKYSLAQDVKRDFERVNEAYASLKSARAEVVYQLYEFGAYLPTVTSQGFISYERDYRYYKLDEIEIVNEGSDKSLYVDHEDKIIYYNAAAASMTALEPNIDGLLQYCSKVERKEEGSHLRYTLSFGSSAAEFDRVEFVIDRSTNLIKELEIRYKPVEEHYADDGPKIERLRITYTYSDVKSTPGTVHIRDFIITNAKSEIALADTYKSYRLINQKN